MRRLRYCAYPTKSQAIRLSHHSIYTKCGDWADPIERLVLTVRAGELHKPI
jgi:hypothetical protein